MSAITRNSLTLFLPTAGIALGQVLQDASGIAPTLEMQSGDRLHQGDVTFARTSAGVYTLTIKDFKGPQGFWNVVATVNTTTVATQTVQVGTATYSGRILSIPINTLIAGSAADVSFFFNVQAF